MARVLIGGDVCPTPGDVELFTAGDASTLFGDVVEEFDASDLVIVNLECPLVDKPSPIAKSGAHFGAPTACVKALAEAGIDVVSLANNHILDHGEAGLQSTLSVCQEAGLQTVGAGENLSAARSMLVVERQGIRIGIISCAEHEFSIASKNSPGANPIDSIEYTRILRREAGNFDHLVVLLHAGKEHTPYPSPKLQNLARYMVEMGASAVVCQHSHYAGVYEHYQDGFISYGQGNLLFNPHPDRRPWLYDGYLVALELPKGSLPVVELIPHVQKGAEPGIRKLGKEDSDECKAKLAEMSEGIANPDFVEKKWLELCRKNKRLYLSILRGQGRIMRNLNKRLGFNTLFYSELESLVLYNALHCESKHEELTTILSDMIAEIRPRHGE